MRTTEHPLDFTSGTLHADLESSFCRVKPEYGGFVIRKEEDMEGSGNFPGAGRKAKGKHRECFWNRKQRKKVLGFFPFFRCERIAVLC